MNQVVDLRRIKIERFPLMMPVPSSGPEELKITLVENPWVVAQIIPRACCIFEKVVMREVGTNNLKLVKVECEEEDRSGRGFITNLIENPENISVTTGTNLLEVALFLSYDQVFPWIREFKIPGWDDATYLAI